MALDQLMLHGRQSFTIRLPLALLLVMTAFSTPAPGDTSFLRHGMRPQAGSTPGFHRPPEKGAPLRIRPPAAHVPAQSSPRAARRNPFARLAAMPKARHGWFWQAHSTALSAAGPGRFAKALASIEAARGHGPRLISPERVHAVSARWGRQIGAAAHKARLSEALLMAVIAVESGGREDALSPKGAQGLMQLMPVTAERFGIQDAFDPAPNIAGGAAYLDRLLHEFRGDILLALAAYNAGEGAIRRHGGVPPYAETRDYVVLVMDALATALALCAEPLPDPRAPCQGSSDL